MTKPTKVVKETKSIKSSSVSNKTKKSSQQLGQYKSDLNSEVIYREKGRRLKKRKPTNKKLEEKNPGSGIEGKVKSGVKR